MFVAPISRTDNKNILVEVLDIPQKQEIIDGRRQQFETPQQAVTEGGLTQTGGLVPESYLSPQDEGGVMT